MRKFSDLIFLDLLIWPGPICLADNIEYLISQCFLSFKDKVVDTNFFQDSFGEWMIFVLLWYLWIVLCIFCGLKIK